MKRRLIILLLSTCIFSCNEEQTPDITTGLTANIALDGSAEDLVSSATGTIHDATAAPNRLGEIGKSMQFNAVDSSYIDFGDLDGVSFTGNQFTISCWLLAIDTARRMAVLSKRTPAGPFEYSFDNHFYLSFFTLDNWVSSGAGTVYGIDPLKASASIEAGTWQHIAFVADGEFLKAYVDGVLQYGVDARISGMSFSNTTAPFIIGAGGAFGVNHFFNGCIDDIRIYNKALNAEAIRFLADS